MLHMSLFGFFGDFIVSKMARYGHNNVQFDKAAKTWGLHLPKSHYNWSNMSPFTSQKLRHFVFIVTSFGPEYVSGVYLALPCYVSEMMLLLL